MSSTAHVRPGPRSPRAAAGSAGRVGFEAHDVTVDAAPRAGRRRPRRIELVDLDARSRRCGRSRTTTRSSLLRQACAIGDQRARRRCCRGCGAGRTEREVARRLESLMLDRGREALVVRDHRGDRRRTRRSRTTGPRDRPVAPGDFVKIDFGARGRRLPRRHDPHLRASGPAARLAARDLRPGRRRPARPDGRRWRRASASRDVDARRPRR